MIRRGEVEPRSGHLLQRFVGVKLRTVVDGDRSEPILVSGDEHLEALVELFGGAALELSDYREAARSFHRAHDAVARPSAHHRVRFPVPELAPALDARRALGDVPLAGEAPPTVVGAVSLTPFLARAAQVRVQIPATALVLPHVAVDRLVADRQHPVRS